MSKIKLGFKIGAGFSAIILFAVLLVAVAYYFLNNIQGAVKEQITFAMPVGNITAEMSRQMQATTIGTTRFLAYHDYGYLNEALKRMADLKAKNLELKALQGSFPELSREIIKDAQARQDNLDGWEKNLRLAQEIARRNDESLANVIKAEEAAVAELTKFLAYMEELLAGEIAAGQMDRLPRRLERKAFADQGILLVERSMKQFWSGLYRRDMDSIAVLQTPLRELLATSEKMLADSTIARNIESLKLVISNLQLLIGNLDTYVQDGRSMLNIVSELGKAHGTTQELTNAAFNFANNFNLQSNNEIAGDVDMAERAMLVVGFVILVCAIIIALCITRMVQRPVHSITQALNQLAEKNFQVDIAPRLLRRNDELGEMVRDLVHVCEVLSATISEVRNASEAVNVAAQEIAQGNDELNHRTQQQAATVEEIASALTQMTSSVRDSANNSQHANELAATASNTAQQGGEVVARTVAAMRDISESSQKINEIINVVNEIAFQTNLLALNAAVEAARAGEAGKGFAVVAGEVRSLAGRSAEAAKQIQRLISDTVGKVEHGNTLVAESGALLKQIIDSAKAVVENISEVSSASQEQAHTIDEINKAMNQMDSGIQQNAAMVEEISSATEALTASAGVALEQVNQFNIIGPGAQQALLPAR